MLRTGNTTFSRFRSNKGWRLVSLLLTAVVLIFGAAGCGPTTSQSFKNCGLPKESVEGDSITQQSTAAINARWGDCPNGLYDVKIQATLGHDTFEQAPYIAGDVALNPQIELINLGTNDAVRIGSTPAYTLSAVTANLSTFANEFPSTTCVVFVTINTHDAASWKPANAQAINDYIRANFNQANLRYADWDAVLQPGDFDTVGNPHPNASPGQQALLDVEAAAIATCPASLPRP